MICTNCKETHDSVGKGGTKFLCPRCYKRKARGADMDARVRAPRGEATMLSLRCSFEEWNRWEGAAKKADVGIRDWARETLDEKAGKK